MSVLTRLTALRPFAPRRIPAVLLTAGLLAAATLVARAQPPRPISYVYPQDGATGVSAGTSVQISFGVAMDHASVEAAFELTPAVPGTTSWSADDVFLFAPDEPLDNDATIVAKLGTGARDARGQPILTTPYSWRFTTWTSDPTLQFSYGVPIQQVVPSMDEGIPVRPGYPRVTLDVTVYRLDDAGFVQRAAGMTPGQTQVIPVAGLPIAYQFQAYVESATEAGHIPLPPAIGSGLYVVEAGSARVQSARTLLVVSNLTMVAQRGLNQTSFWATKLPDVELVQDATIQTYDADGHVLASAATDASGVARTASSADAAFGLTHVGSEIGVVGLESPWLSRSSYYWWWDGGWTPEPPTVVGHVQTDRPIYRPGHTMHFKSVLRRVSGDGYLLPEATTPVTVTIRDAGGNAVGLLNPTLDDYGAVSGDVPLSEDAALGTWRVEVAAAGVTVAGTFEVQEYVKPDYAVEVTTDRPWYVQGETAHVSVQADYYFGQPVTGADVTLRIFQGYYWRGGGNQVGQLTGVTGQDGAWSVDYALPAVGDPGQPLWFEAEVVDATRRPVVADTSVYDHYADFALSLQADRYGVRLGEPFKLHVATTDHDGAPVPSRAVSIQVQGYQYPGGYYTVRTVNLKTGADGTVATDLQLPAGWFQLNGTATDDHGRQLTAWSYAWVTDPAYPWYWREGLEISADKPSYKAGDTAHLLVRSPITTTALVTLEREDVVAEYVVQVAGATDVAVPITEDLAPNVWAKVQVWDPGDSGGYYGESAAAARLIYTSVNLPVDASSERLDVAVTPRQAHYEPQDDAVFDVRVTDASGAPAQAQLSFALVDKAVLALAADTNGSLFDAFWSSRSDTVATYDSLRPSDWYNYPERDAGPGGPPVPGMPAPTATAGAPDQEQPSQATPRRDFPDTAYWAPAIVTDAAGHATITVHLPDNLTTWDALARAITKDTKAGEGRGEIVVTKAIIADAALPRFAVQGDQFALDILGRNYTSGDLAGACTLTSPGLVQLDPGTRQVDLPVNETRFGRWSVVASDLGANPVTARITTAAGEDAVELPLEVQPFTVPDRFVRSGAVVTGTDESFAIPFNAVPGSSSVEVRLAPGVAVSILDGLDDLIGYPYGCVEQTMSRLMPDAVIGRLVLELDIQPPDSFSELPAMIALGLQKLSGFQNDDGGWGWWTGTSNTFTTAYVVQGLTLVKEAGEPVDDAMLTRGVTFLETSVASPQSDLDRDPRVQAYAMYVLAMAGHGHADLAAALLDQPDKLDSLSLAALALALDAGGRADDAGRALDLLVARVTETATTASWPFEPDVGQPWTPYYWYTMASTEKNTAFALDALARLRPESPLTPKAARWLLERRTHYGWRTTQGTSYAVLALTDYLVASGELQSDYSWSVALDGARVAAGAVTAGNITERPDPIVLDGAKLPPGDHVLTLTKQGTGTLFYTVFGQLALYYDGFAPTEAATEGLAVTRQYMPVEGRSGPDGWHVGDVVNVRLTVTTKDEVWYALVEDQLPAGFEALNDALDTESSKVPLPEPGLPWYWRGYERKELRDDRVTFFTTYLGPGEHVFDYAVRAVTPGTFSARPAEAYAMYRPEVWGRSGSDRVSIATDVVAARPPLAGDYDRDCRLTAFDAALVAQAWEDGDRRDVNGDGRVDAADIALAAGRAGTTCGTPVGPPPHSDATVAVTLDSPGSVRVGEPFWLTVSSSSADAGVDVGAYDLTLSLPTSDYEVVGAAAGDLLPSAYLLRPKVGGSTVRLGGYALTGKTLGAATVLARVQLKPKVPRPGSITLSRGVITTSRGAEHRVTLDGATISPEPGALHNVWLPWVEQR